METIHESWKPILHSLYEEPLSLLNSKLSEISFQPDKNNIFKVYRKSVKDIKVVILGQDPYPSPSVAVGMAFGVSSSTRIPVSLKNIRKELLKEGFYLSPEEEWKTLTHLEEQGVFLLNTALTVETGNAGSHLNLWKNFIRETIRYISTINPTIWLLWGNYAQSFITDIRYPFIVKNYDLNSIQEIPIGEKTNYILTAAHPAAEAYRLNAGFFGCNHFIYTNEILKKSKKISINF